MSTIWLDDLKSGAADPLPLMRSRGHRWTAAEVREAVEIVQRHPGRELVLSVHSTHSSASKTRHRRTRDERWSVPGLVLRTRLLGEHPDPLRLAVVTATFTPTTTEEK